MLLVDSVAQAIRDANLAALKYRETRDPVDYVLWSLACRRPESAAHLERVKARMLERGIVIQEEVG